MAWIQRLDDIGVPPTVNVVRNCANSILQRNNLDENPPPTVEPN
jgi:hypothetical protein